MTTCKLPLGTGVYCEFSHESKQIVDYLISFDIHNIDHLSGTDPKQYYGLSSNNKIRMYHSDFENHITFEDFKKLLLEPIDSIINEYNLY